MFKHVSPHANRLRRAAAPSLSRFAAWRKGVGLLVAVTFKSAVDDPSRITKSTAVGALFGARPFHIEALSGLFDFNRAPFFQSFVEVRVETSRKRVVLILNGIRGPLHWRDLQTGGTVLPLGATPHDPVEFVVPMDRE